MNFFLVLAIAAQAQSICPSGSVGSCTVKNNRSSSCVDMIAPQLPPNFASECQQQGGVPSTSPCATASVVGSCDMTQNGGGVVMRFYPPTKAEIFPRACDQMRAKHCK